MQENALGWRRFHRGFVTTLTLDCDLEAAASAELEPVPPRLLE